MAGEQLRVTEGDERGKRLRVDAELVIGRTVADDDGRFGEDPEISRRHARISRGADGLLMIEDLGSANGTFVNGERLQAPRPLKLGDVVRLGNTFLEVTDSSGAGIEQQPNAQHTEVDEAPSVPAQASEELVITAGPELSRKLAIGEELIVGRSVSGAGRLGDDGRLSRRHARVARNESGQITIEDLGSANGTFVNGERLRGTQVLAPGDSVQLGSTTLQLTAGGQAPAAAAPPPQAPPPPARAPAAPASAPPPPPTPMPSAPAHGAELAAGSVFAGCRVEDVISHAARGTVYRAEELALQRPVALKVISTDYSQEERFRQRFQRESRVAAATDHPNVIPIYDAGDQGGVLFIMMRLVEGTDLRALIGAERRLDPLRAARIVRQVAAALDAAHSQGILHRDVKASNVLLTRRDHAYLSDFGLAKHATSGDELTRQGSIVARAVFVAPEQIMNERIDARTDIYALGCVLFEALTGEAPFARWQGGPQVLAPVDAPVPSPLELCPDLPREFDEVVGRAMAKDPNDRYPSAGDLGQAALVAAGGQRRASPWSVVATGEAAAIGGPQPAAAIAELRAEEPAAAPLAAAAGASAEPQEGAVPAVSGGSATLRWVIALAGLVLVAVGMVAALNGISSL